MSKRVHEIAKELGINSKEVIGRLNEAGIEVAHHSATINDPDFERVFGAGASSPNGAPNGTPNSSANGHAEAVATAPVEAAPATPAAAPQQGEGKKGGGKKRRRVVIDASATNRGPRNAASRPATAPAPAREEPKPDASDEVRVEPGRRSRT